MIKFEVEKFNGKGNFILWEKRVKALLMQQDQDLAGKVRKTCKYVKRRLRRDGSKGDKHDPTMSRRQGYV